MMALDYRLALVLFDGILFQAAWLKETLVKLSTRPNSRIDELLPDIADRVAAHSAQWTLHLLDFKKCISWSIL